LYLVYQNLSFHCQIRPPFHMLPWCCVILFFVKLLQGIDKGARKCYALAKLIFEAFTFA
jgi:hypothetical protein